VRRKAGLTIGIDALESVDPIVFHFDALPPSVLALKARADPLIPNYVE
jgi:hypothetical protein